MLDVKYIVEHPDAVRKNAANKNERRAEIDKVLALNDQKKKLQLSFEEALAELQALVKSLEKGDSKLDDAINSYQRGVDLKRHCEAKLRDAQLKVEKIVQGANGTVATEPAKID